MGNFNSRVANRRMKRITKIFGMEGVNENGTELIGKCAAKGFMIGSI